MSTPGTQDRIVRALEAASRRIEDEDRRRFEPIAIVGMGCRFPGARFAGGVLVATAATGVTRSGQIPAERWDVDRAVRCGPRNGRAVSLRASRRIPS